jgi:ribosomal-protein-alanine N-acetyltransferase
MTESLARVLVYCFEGIGLNRIEGFCLVNNHAAVRVLEKVGMVQEGVLREYVHQKGAFRDLCVHSILEQDPRM